MRNPTNHHTAPRAGEIRCVSRGLRPTLRGATLCIVAFGFALGLHAQTPGRLAAPRIGYVYPAGAQQGTTVTLTVGGQFLDKVDTAEVFGDGVRCRVVSRQHPLTQKELEPLKEEAEALREKRKASRAAGAKDATTTWTPADTERAEELRRMQSYRVNLQSALSISEIVTLELTVAADASVGEREIRLHSPFGLSNPLLFLVGQLPESSDPAAPPSTALPEVKDGKEPLRPKNLTTERTVALPAVVNGQILPGEVDRVRFNAKRGQRLVVSVQARALIPYLADAVPGWFQATLGLYDAQGRELAYDDNYRFNPDPVLFFEVPDDGDYALEIKDSIYRGRQDFVYRITLGELPFVTNLFPLGGAVGETTAVELKGWNLPAARATIDGRSHPRGRLQFSVPKNGIPSNTMPFALDQGPQARESEGNNGPAQPQEVTWPLIVDGRIERPGDEDAFAFDGRAGQEVVLEVLARRLNSPLDSLLRLLGPDGRELARNDDSEDKGAGLSTHHADSRLQLKLPADGRYVVVLSDTQHQGGAEFAYRLHLRDPQPGYSLRVVPSSVNLRAGTHVPLTVFALRQDGFDGPIQIGLNDNHGLFGLSGALIPSGQDKVRMTLTTSAAAREKPYPLNVVGQATIAGENVRHAAIPCEDMMQAFAYRHLVPAKRQQVAITGRGAGLRGVIRICDTLPLQLTPGLAGTLHVNVPLGRFFTEVKAELSEAPPGVALEPNQLRGDTLKLTFTVDAATAKPGSRGNLIVQLSGEREGGGGDKAKKGNRPRVPLTALPAIPYEIVAAKL